MINIYENGRVSIKIVELVDHHHDGREVFEVQILTIFSFSFSSGMAFSLSFSFSPFSSVPRARDRMIKSRRKKTGLLAG